MRIKNIQDYRSFYKNDVRRLRLDDRNENFIGNFLIAPDTDDVEFGWFEIYHGDKEGYGKAEAGIENFLQSFLDMAKDGQAVYEFLQNAVDAGSTHYAMVWGKDELDGNHYLLVANNGKMFNLDSVRSILNVGSSTKSNDSQTIGKFGIGFKLAHRLVGKDNGLNELINEHSGPILFSWKNYEIEQLANGEAIEPEKFSYHSKANRSFEMADDCPWLFKILITCFPCLPENNAVKELPKMANGMIAEANPFSEEEYHVLSRWTKRYQHILDKQTYNEGALFFIKLGKGKEEELAEVNLKEGVKFAIAILKETANETERHEKLLHTVQLNEGETITYPDLEYIKFSITKEKDIDTYAYIRFGADHYSELIEEQKRKMENEADIEVLFGFRKYDEIGSYFKGAPNLYLYFPLSEEVHNFNYILHSNAFYKGSSRTFLHKGNGKEDGINERLLKVIVDRIREKLIELSNSNKPDCRLQFLHFYASLLTSGKSTNQARLWIETPYINPVDDELRKIIPVRNNPQANDFTTVEDKTSVFIKETAIDIDPEIWQLKNVNWFYWDSRNSEIISKGGEKLQIRPYTIFDLLENAGIENNINSWLAGEEDRIKIVFQELCSISPDKATVDRIRQQLLQLKLFRFSNGELLSLSEFLKKESEGFVLLHNTLGDIKELLIKVGLITTVIDLNDFEFVDKYRSFLLQSSKHSGYTELTKLFSAAVSDEKLSTLGKNDKLKIFNAFRTFNSDAVNERIKELKLFANNLGRPTAFKSLLGQQDSSGWKSIFSIAKSEYDDQLKAYLLEDRKVYYQQIIYPYWSDILKLIAISPTRVQKIVEDITLIYNESNWTDKQQHFLSNKNLILFKREVLSTENIFIKSTLSNLSEEEFNTCQDMAYKFYKLHIPDRLLIKCLIEHPFSYSSVVPETALDADGIFIDEVNNLLLFCSVCDISFFDYNTIYRTDSAYQIKNDLVRKQYFSSKRQVINYVEKYHNQTFALLPENIRIENGTLDMSESALIVRLIELFKEETMEQELDLVELLLQERQEDKKKLLASLTYIRLDASWQELHQNELYLKLIHSVVDDYMGDQSINALQDKIIIYREEEEVNIGKIESAQDNIEIKKGDKFIHLSQSLILELDTAGIISFIQDFHDEAIKRDLISSSKAEKIFKIATIGVTDELIARFEKASKATNLLTDALPITNAHQLAFVLFSGKYDSAKLKKFAVQCQNDTWYFLKKQKFLPSDQNKIHIDESYLLNERYADFQSIVSLNDFEVVSFGEDEEDVIAPRFLFIKGLDPDLLLSSDDTEDKLNYLYNGWRGVPPTARDYKKNEDWESFFDITPSSYVLSGKHIESEVLPITFLNWSGEDKSKHEFLRAIGVFVNDKFLEPVRQYLLKEVEQLPQEIDPLKFNDSILLNTLLGLSGGFSELGGLPVIYTVEKDNLRIQIIERIISHLFDSNENCPVLIHADHNSFLLTQKPIGDIRRINELLHLKMKNCGDNDLNHIYSTYAIIKSDLLTIQDIHDQTDELELFKEFRPMISEQHDEPFYHSWSKLNNIILFKEDQLWFQVLDPQYDNRHIATITGDSLHEKKEGEITLLYYPKAIHLEGLKLALDHQQNPMADAIGDLLARRDQMLARIYNAYNSANKDDVSNEHLSALQEAFREETARQERKDLIDSIKQSNRYSFDWFISYLDYLLTFTRNKSDNSKQKTIRFQSVKRQIVNDLISEKYYLLCGSSSYINDSIEEASDFSLSITLNTHKRIEIKVEGAQKQGQDLLIFCPNGMHKDVTKSLDQIFLVEIAFVPQIDLLKELRNAFNNPNNLERWTDINQSLPPVKFIYGPPGTGKTTNLGEKILKFKVKDPNVKILFLTPTNKAADVLTKKLVIKPEIADDAGDKQLEGIVEDEDYLSIYRIGKPTDPELEAYDSEIYQSSIDERILNTADVIAMTIHRLPYTSVFTEERGNEIMLFKLIDHWDYIVFDEASMINLPYVVFAMMAIAKFSPKSKFIIAGDPKQIPPVIDVDDKDLEELDIQDENVYSMMNISSFNESEQFLRQQDSIENLTIQYRSVFKIGKLFSQLSYDDLLEHYRENAGDNPKVLPAKLQDLLTNNVLFIDVPLNNEDSVFKIRQLFYSSYHVYSAILVSELIKWLDNKLPDDELWKIGLIAPYKAQALMMNKLIASYGISDKIKIYADTVHGFQGDECDLVFFVCNPNNYYFTGHPKSLLSKEYIYNVAISRAKDYLIVLHPFSNIPGNSFINAIKGSYQSNFGIPAVKRASDIESLLFGSPTFIYDNSYMTGHDTVNVFGQLEKKYFIKANSTAVDIQLRNIV